MLLSVKSLNPMPDSDTANGDAAANIVDQSGQIAKEMHSISRKVASHKSHDMVGSL